VSTPASERPSDARGEVVPFSNIAAAMARSSGPDVGAMRALVATVVAIGPDDRLADAAQALQSLGDAGTVRGILVSEGDNPAPSAHVAGNTVALYGLTPAFVNNAVAALRLSSLPTLVWWRGGRADTVDGLAELADRIVLDEEQPETVWRRALTLVENSAFSDMRWAKLTQWRALMAHFFDIPEVRAAIPTFTRLTIHGEDEMSARLYAAWLTSTLEFAPGFAVEIQRASGDDRAAALREIRLGDGEQELRIRLAGHSCVETAVSVQGHRSVSRVVAVTDCNLTHMLTEELRIRARDLAFERALRRVIAP
jgi:glucose-6-phosphate dehydrogenase assembly protein OpcA